MPRDNLACRSAPIRLRAINFAILMICRAERTARNSYGRCSHEDMRIVSRVDHAGLLIPTCPRGASSRNAR
jgi:hypothetical protein